MQDAIEVFEQIRRATRTIRKLPRVTVRSKFCNWPEIIRSFYECYGYNDPDPPRLAPTPRQITQMDQVISWLAWLSQYGEECPRIIWARAENRSWRHIATVAGLSKDTCRERFRVGLHAIFYAVEDRRLS